MCSCNVAPDQVAQNGSEEKDPPTKARATQAGFVVPVGGFSTFREVTHFPPLFFSKTVSVSN
jgi:hypothetical protein